MGHKILQYNSIAELYCPCQHHIVGLWAKIGHKSGKKGKNSGTQRGGPPVRQDKRAAPRLPVPLFPYPAFRSRMAMNSSPVMVSFS